ncbi:hypothetical protein ACRAVF_27275 [Bradyrhizobium oligotrophicum S58]
MTLPVKNKFDPAFPLVDSQGRPTPLFRDYMVKLDALVTQLVTSGNTALTDAANDAAAAAAGVGVGQLYRNGSFIMVRVV